MKEVLAWDRGEERQKEAKPSARGAKHPGCAIEAWDLGGIGRKRTRGLHAFVITASGELRKACCLEEGCEGGWAKSLALFPQQIPQIVERDMLLAPRDDALPERSGLGGCVGTPVRWNEALRIWIVAAVMDKDAETARSVSKAFGRFGGRERCDEASAQGLLLALRRVGRRKKESLWVCSCVFCLYSHVSTL